MQILAESAVRITVLALGVAVVLRVLRIRSPGLVHAAWTAVVVVMLLLPAAVAWGPEVAVPLLPSHSANAILDPLPGPGALEESRTAVAAAAASPDVAPARLSWRAAAGAVYFAGVGLLLLRLGLGIRWGRVLRGSAVLSHGRLMHPACVTPMTIGLFAPAVVLPSDWASWSEDELAAVLAHEEAHVRRRDPLVAALALLNRAIFWFHPLAWWLQHEVGRRAEQACDDAVIARGHDRECYSSCLVQFARRASGAGGRIVPVAMAMPGAGLRERLALLAAPPPARLPGSRLACAAVAYGVLVGMCTAAVPIAAAPGQSLPPATGQRLVVHASEHFDIVHGGLAADRLTETAREAEAAYAQLSAAFKYDLPRRVTVILVPRDGDRLDGAATAREAVLSSGAVWGQRLVISLESLDRRSGIIVHELTHQFAFEIIPETSRVAPFLVEGLAEHQRGVWTAENVRMTRDAAAADAIPSLASLASADRRWAHAMFDFVAAQQGAEGIRQLLFALRARETLPQALPMAFGLTLDQFDGGFRAYVRARFGQR